ncbi:MULTISPECIES: AI-2E family transporter [unclassified Geodermatophilus]|uniref:AI-2E family transporter n=1 Tax=unclassified Geodermatophilus TaxID=2637632 RepID=UPI003EE9FFA1
MTDGHGPARNEAEAEGAEPEVRGPLPLWLTVVLGVAGTAIALWGLHAASAILGPVVLAFVLAVVVHPLIGALVRRGIRRGVAVAVAVVVVDGGLIAFAVALAVSIGQFATVLPQYSAEWRALVDGVRSLLVGAGVGPEQVADMLPSVELQSVLAVVGDLLAGIAGSVGALFLLLATALFMTVEAAGLPERLAAVPGTTRLRAALGDFARYTRRYVVVTTVFGLLVAVVDTLALIVLGIPLPLVWGLLSFLTNYVPNIGFFLGLVPPALLALLVGGPGLAVLVIVIYTVVNFLLQSVLQPVVVGSAVNLSVTLSFLSVIVWTAVLGPMGAILAVPLTLFLHAVLIGQDPDRRWARTLLAGPSGTATTGGRGSAWRRPGRPAPARRDGEDGGEPGEPVRRGHQPSRMSGTAPAAPGDRIAGA